MVAMLLNTASVQLEPEFAPNSTAAVLTPTREHGATRQDPRAVAPDRLDRHQAGASRQAG
jgi:hypothetical protein